jgi:hypothetical protein
MWRYSNGLFLDLNQTILSNLFRDNTDLLLLNLIWLQTIKKLSIKCINYFSKTQFDVCMHRASSYNMYTPCIILLYACTVHHPTICMHHNMYAPCIILQYVCTTICIHRASSYYMYAPCIILQYVCTVHHPTICMQFEMDKRLK